MHICRESSKAAVRPCCKVQQEFGKGTGRRVDNGDLTAAAGTESDDELDGAGAGSGEEAMEEAKKEHEGIADKEFARDN